MASVDANSFHHELLQLSNALDADQLKNMKFLCRELIGKRILEKINTGWELFDVLMQRNKLSAEDTTFLEQLLTQVDRPDLSDIIRRFNTNCGAASAQSEPSEAERGKIDLAAEVIAASLGRTWRKLARKLNLIEVRIQSIAQKQLDLEETAMVVIWEWRKAQGSQARVEELVAALRECNQNRTADEVEDKIAQACFDLEGLGEETR
ncbi:hypothetical protein CRUP_010402 [Coryphaenoides rupestris]|nr:hypothetical protein CRUP_010402 [Coryphaenoides rupestris]